jgi:Zn-dependent M28 family amino/carboxypeptidase
MKRPSPNPRGPRPLAAAARRGFLTALALTVAAMAAMAAVGAVAASSPSPASGAAPPATVGAPDAGARTAAETITAPVLRAPIRLLASDLLEGRGPATRGDELARLYLATALEELGFAPGGPGGGWQQPFEIVGITADLPPVWSFQAAGGDHGGATTESGGRLDLRVLDDYIAGSGVQRPRAEIAGAEVVFVGYGIEAPEYGWDDFKGVDLRGKVLLMLNNDPDWDPDLFAGTTRLYYGRWTYKYESAARRGAAGTIIVHTRESAGYPWQVVRTSWSGEQFELPAGDEPRIQVAGWATEDAARRLARLAGRDLDALVAAARSRDFRPVPLGITTSIAFANSLSRAETANVLGLLPGSDPALAGQAVVYTAHHDHLGTAAAESASGGADRIYNGARDNAAGVAQVLAIARAFAALPEPPRRSVLFLFVAAEEQGLLGSQYYAAHPTFPPGSIAANLNYDGGNIWGQARDVRLVGYGKSSLDRVAEAVAAFQGRTIEPDPTPEQGSYYRSDQFNFAKIGVPALYLKTGTEFAGRPAGWGKEATEAWIGEHYHQPSDELTADWDFTGMIEDARLGFYAGLAVADADELPAWNPGDEFAAARAAARAAAAGAGP